MRVSVVIKTVSALLRLFSLVFIVPAMLALVETRWMTAVYFFISMAATACVGFIGHGLCRRAESQVFSRLEALGVVSLAWLAIALSGAVPYVLLGISPVDALFESMSGFTTTGATILTDFEAYDRAFFLWRSMTQWFGGVGVIALFVVVLPRLGIAGRQIFFTEASDASTATISPKARATASRLWVLYCVLTLILIIALIVAGMSVFDAVCHAFTTMSAGGFSPNGASIAGYENPAVEWILVVFMLLAGASFTLQYRAYTSDPRELLRDGEFVVYIGVAIGIGLALASVLPDDHGAENALRLALFQSASLISSTGYASADFNEWSEVAKALLIIVMCVGGCAGSAAGGAKVVRLVLVGRHVSREITRTIHPRAVLPIKYKGTVIPRSVMNAVFTLVALYFSGYLIIGAVVCIAGEADLETGFSVSLACLGNIGPGFGPAGPMGNFAGFSNGIKLLLTWAMWIGRLEIIAVLALLHPHCWRNMRFESPKKR